MTYTLCLDDLVQAVHAHTVAAGVAQALGREVDLPDWGQVRVRFDAALAAEPEQDRPDSNTPTAIIMRALGLR